MTETHAEKVQRLRDSLNMSVFEASRLIQMEQIQTMLSQADSVTDLKHVIQLMLDRYK